jgi:hypothetical protein
VPVVLGAVFQATQSFFLAFATLAAGPLLGMVLMLGVRERGATHPTSAVKTEAAAR